MELSGEHSELDNGEDRRSLLLFGLICAAYGVVAKDIFPSIYTAAQHLWWYWNTLPPWIEVLSSWNAMVGLKAEWERLGVALLLLVYWGGYFWLVVGARYAARGFYSIRALTGDIVVAIILFCIASSIQHGLTHSGAITSTTWFGILTLTVLLHGRILHFIWTVDVPEDRTSRMIISRWLRESITAIHINCVTASCAILGVAVSGVEENGSRAIKGIAVALLGYGVLVATISELLQYRARKAQSHATLWIGLNDGCRTLFIVLMLGAVIVCMVAAFIPTALHWRAEYVLPVMPLSLMTFGIVTAGGVAKGIHGLINIFTGESRLQRQYKAMMPHLVSLCRSDAKDDSLQVLICGKLLSRRWLARSPGPAGQVLHDSELIDLVLDQARNGSFTARLGAQKKIVVKGVCAPVEEDQHGYTVSALCLCTLGASSRIFDNPEGRRTASEILNQVLAVLQYMKHEDGNSQLFPTSDDRSDAPAPLSGG